jgi:uncharacterized repeat protein (TIGR03803 family)
MTSAEIRARAAFLLGLAVLCVAVSAPAQSSPAYTFKTLHKFTDGDGSEPLGGLVQDVAGNLYGTTLAGGPYAHGTVFKFDTNGRVTVLFGFNRGGTAPQAGLTQDSEGNLYGTATDGGPYNGGMVFKLNAAGKASVMYKFKGSPDGAGSVAPLVMDISGNLYGTTTSGGDSSCRPTLGCGVVFKVSKTGKETVLYRFAGTPDGELSDAGLVLDGSGNLYGTTYYGGVYAAGTVFRVDETGSETVLYSFSAQPDGAVPAAGLIRDESGNLFGTTEKGGTGACFGGCGTVFMLGPGGSETVLYNFTGSPDGEYPFASLIRDSKGNLYGTTAYGGTGKCNNGNGQGCGTVFKLTQSKSGWEETVLHSFNGHSDGSYSFAPLLRDAAGNLYGTTYEGGTFSQSCRFGCGTIFRLTP